MTRSGYFRPVSGGISGLCVEPDDKSIWRNARSNGPVNWGEPERAPFGIEKRPPRTIYLSIYLCTVNCMSVEKCVLRTEVFYHYFSVQPRNMQCMQFFNGHAIDCTYVYAYVFP